MYLTREQRAALIKAAARSGPLESRIEAIDMLVAGFRHANPRAFHTRETLARRVFFHTPLTMIPYHHSVKAWG